MCYMWHEIVLKPCSSTTSLLRKLFTHLICLYTVKNIQLSEVTWGFDQ